MISIGYFGDGPWAHETFKRLIVDKSIKIKFVSLRFDKRDPVLISMAEKNKIPLEISKNINSDEFIERMKSYDVDLFVSMSFNQIFKSEIMNLPKFKTINCHAGKLPYYRGRNILNWALINDEKEFGITVHFMDEGIDTGDIILQKSYPITDDDDYGTLLERAYTGCADILYESIKRIQSGEVNLIKQDTIDRVGMYCGRRQAGDEVINWASTSREIFNFVRALCEPGPMACSALDEEVIRINRVKMIENAKPYINIPGQIIGKTEQGFYVKTKDTFVDGLVSKYAEMADYQKKNLGVQESQKDMLKKLMLTQEEFLELAGYCKEIGIRFLSTPFDIGSIHFLNPLQNIWKIPSGEITNYPYLVEIARTGKEVILSTGMSTMEEVEAAFNLLEDHGAGAITLLHCTTEYPAPMREINLRAMLTLKAHCGCKVGYSDHSEGIEVPVAAVAIGAKVIEKHFTLDKFMDGPDHKASLEPEELSAMVRAIRNVELALGSMEKKPSESERKNISVARKSIVAARRIKKGEILSKDNITTKRPGNGLDPMRWKEVVGTFAVREFQEDELIEI